MLILINLLNNYFKLQINGILHVGAHDCEEMKYYNEINIKKENIYWIEAIPSIVNKNRERNIPNVYEAIIDNVDDKKVELNIANNIVSSSILNFGTHSTHHPEVKYVDKITGYTIKLDTFIKKNNIPIHKINFLNLDIQGIELRALKSMGKYLHYIDYIYTEVNSEYVYDGCDLIGEIDTYLKLFGFERKVTKFFNKCGWGDAFYIKNKKFKTSKDSKSSNKVSMFFDLNK